MLAHWIILPPVGGISIYETFEVSLHPLKVQIDAKLGRRIMEYLWPDRRNRPQIVDDEPVAQYPEMTYSTDVPRPPPLRTSLDSPRTLQRLQSNSIVYNNGLAPPASRKLSPSRSFTDLRSTREDRYHSHLLPSNDGHSQKTESPDASGPVSPRLKVDFSVLEQKGDAAVMKTRSSQKTFVFVKIARFVIVSKPGASNTNFVYILSSMNLVLSVIKEGSFECHDVRIKTRDLVYRNQTSSVRLL